MRLIGISSAAITWRVGDSRVLHLLDLLFGQLHRATDITSALWPPPPCESIAHHASDLDRVDPSNVAIETLPLGHPRLRRVGQGDQAFVDLRRAFLDGLGVTSQAQEVLAVGASFTQEFLPQFDDSTRESLVGSQADLPTVAAPPSTPCRLVDVCAVQGQRSRLPSSRCA